MSLKANIMTAFSNRLTNVTTVNGYSTNVRKVYFDKIPMGIQLGIQHLPCIFLLDGPDNPTFQQSCVIGQWDFRLQLWHNDVSDSIMQGFVRDVYKVIYANSPTAEVWDQFRSIHESVYEVIPLSISPDLNMIEANRVTELSFLLRYRTKLYNM